MDDCKIKNQLRILKIEHKSAFTSCNTILGLLCCYLPSVGGLTVDKLRQYIQEVKDEN